jgi:hypothetical protein
VLGPHDPVRREVDVAGHRGGVDLVLGPDQHRGDQSRFGCRRHSCDRVRVDGVDDGGPNGLLGSGRVEQPVQMHAFVQMHGRRHPAWPPDLLRGRQHLGRAVDDRRALLVRAQTVKHHPMTAWLLLGHRDRHDDEIAETQGPTELQGLAQIDRAGTGQLGAEQGRDQRSAPQAVRDHFMEPAALRVVLVDVGRVDVARHDREQLDVPKRQATPQRGRVADVDLVERAVLDHVVVHWDTPPQALSSQAAGHARPSVPGRRHLRPVAIGVLPGAAASDRHAAANLDGADLPGPSPSMMTASTRQQRPTAMTNGLNEER